MATSVQKGQIVRAAIAGASVYDTYKGGRKILFSAARKNEELGEATGWVYDAQTSSVTVEMGGNSSTTPGEATEFVELEYVVQTTGFFGIPTFTRRKGYAPVDDVVIEEPTDDDPWGIGSGIDSPSTGTSSGTQTPDTSGEPAATSGKTIPGAEVDTTRKSDPDGKLAIVRKDTTATGLPTWAKWALGGLGLVMLVLAGVLIFKKPKKKGVSRG